MSSSNLPKAYIIFNNSGEPEIVFDKHSDALEYIQHNTPAYTIKHCAMNLLQLSKNLAKLDQIVSNIEKHTVLIESAKKEYLKNLTRN